VAHKPVAHKPVATLTSSQKPVHRAGVTTPSPTSGLAATGGPPLLAVVAIVSIGAAILARRVRGQRSLASMLDATTTPP
jgi:hypothetical protein